MLITTDPAPPRLDPWDVVSAATPSAPAVREAEALCRATGIPVTFAGAVAAILTAERGRELSEEEVYDWLDDRDLLADAESREEGSA